MSVNNDKFVAKCELQMNALRDIYEASILFHSNKFKECEEFLRSKSVENPTFAHTHIYGLAVIKTIMAIFTNEKVGLS